MDKKYKNFLTGLYTWSPENYPLGFSFNGKWGKIEFIKKKKEGQNFLNEEERCLIIKTTSEEKLKEILDLLYGCLTVFVGYDSYGFDFEDIYRVKNKEIFSFGDTSCPLSTTYLYVAGIMAAKASFREKYIYAIQKASFSMNTYSIPFMDLNPTCGNLLLPTIKNPFPVSIRIKMTSAIISAFSAIEELGLLVSTDNNNDRINGLLIDKKRKEIIKELKKKNINTERKFYWDRRGKGKSTIFDNVKKPRFEENKNKKPEWSCYPYVRDEEIDLVDAIDRASYLRSCISSHKLSSKKENRKNLIKILSPYDVSNVQLLSRTLILDSLKLGRIWSV